MMMIPVQVIAFFIAVMVIPADVREFTIEWQGKKIQWKKSPSSAWHAVDSPKESAGDYSVTNGIVTVRNNGQDSKTDVSQFLKLGKASESDFSKVRQIVVARESLGTPILIRRERGKVILSQQKGALFEKPAVISWKAKEQ
jgi:hypothetical protein